MRRPGGLKAWPTLRRREAELVAQVCDALGKDPFDRAFAQGLELNRQQAVTAVRASGLPESGDLGHDGRAARPQTFDERALGTS
jgi:hypothetical protein